VRKRERNNSADTKVSEEGGGVERASWWAPGGQPRLTHHKQNAEESP